MSVKNLEVVYLDSDELVVTIDSRSVTDKIDSLVESIRNEGQIHPVLINSKHEIVCGRQRAEACRRLGIKVRCEIDKTRDDPKSRRRATYHENLQRSSWSPEEKATMRAMMENDKENTFSPAQVTEIVGMGERNAKLVARVTRMATDPSVPDQLREKAEEARKEIATTNNVATPYKKLKEFERANPDFGTARKSAGKPIDTQVSYNEKRLHSLIGQTIRELDDRKRLFTGSDSESHFKMCSDALTDLQEAITAWQWKTNQWSPE